MKRLTFLSLIIPLFLIFLISCSEKDSTGIGDDPGTPPELAQEPDLVFAFPDSADLVNFTAVEIDYNGELVTAYSLDQFIDFQRVHVPELEYSYEIVAEDGYSPRNGGYPDLSWAQLETGYLLPTEKFRTYFPGDEIASAYNVKYAQDINLYRTVIVVDSEGSEIVFQTGALETVDVYHQAGDENFYTDPGFALSNFISDYVTTNPEGYQYHFTASDDYTVVFSWDDIQNGWWLTTLNKAVFLNADGTEFHSSFKYLIRIELVD